MIWVLSNGLWQLYKAGGRIEEARNELAGERKKNEELRNKLGEVESGEFIEMQAREKLNLQRPGETVVMVQDVESQKENKEVTEEREVFNWEKWWKLFR